MLIHDMGVNGINASINVKCTIICLNDVSVEELMGVNSTSI